jgi:hypothetical protein
LSETLIRARMSYKIVLCEMYFVLTSLSPATRVTR